MRWALDAKARADVVPVGAGPGDSMAVTPPGAPVDRHQLPAPAPVPGPTLDQAG